LVVETAEPFEGMSGQIKLNTAGDRIGEDYGFWIVGKDNDSQS
jgi:ABC-type branched-subunit amino acid transport system substrate-binding protein